MFVIQAMLLFRCYKISREVLIQLSTLSQTTANLIFAVILI